MDDKKPEDRWPLVIVLVTLFVCTAAVLVAFALTGYGRCP